MLIIKPKGKSTSHIHMNVYHLCIGSPTQRFHHKTPVNLSRAHFCYCNSYHHPIDKMMYKTILIVLVSTACIVSVDGLDSTLASESSGPHVVRAVISKITTSNISFLTDEAVAPFMRIMAYVETRDGAEINPEGGGIWNIDCDQFMEAKNDLQDDSDIIMELAHEHQLNHIGPVHWNNLYYENLSIPLYSGLVARVIIHLKQRSPRPLTILQTNDYFSYWNFVFKDRMAQRNQWTTYAENLTRIEDEGNHYF